MFTHGDRAHLGSNIIAPVWGHKSIVGGRSGSRLVYKKMFTTTPPRGCRVTFSWRTSYSKLDGDEAARTRFQAYLARAAASIMDHAKRAMNEPTRHKPNSETKANELERLEKKAKVANLRAKHFRDKRRK